MSLLALAALGMLGPGVIAHELEYAAPPAAPAAARSSARQEAQAWMDFFLECASSAPDRLHSETIAQAWTLFDRWLRQSEDPPPDTARSLLESASRHYAALRLQHPGLAVAWDGDGDVPGAPASRLTLARGVQAAVLVEVTNRTSQAVSLSAAFQGTPGPAGNPVRIESGGRGMFWARLRVDAPQLKEATLELVATGSQARSRQHRVPLTVEEPARLRGRLFEGANPEPFPGRVWIQASDGLMRRDERLGANDTLSRKPLLGFVFAGRGASQALPFFYSDGEFDLLLPPGPATVTLERGFEHPIVSTNVVLQPGETRTITLRSARFLDMRARGWVSGDTHIHWARNTWDVDEDIDLLAVVQRAEDLRVANNLTLRHHTTNQNFIAPTQFPMGPVPGRCGPDWHIQMAEEYRNEEFYGHLIFLNLRRLIEPISTGFMGGPPFHDYPPNLPAILEARAQGGITIEAHGLGRNNDVPVNVAQSLTDSLDQIEADDYYRFLECGFMLPLSNGSDHPARVAGCARVYVKTELPFTYERWIDGIRSNRTFTTSGPLLSLDVNGRDIGDVIQADATTTLRIRARAASRFPVGTLQIVSNGKVIAETRSEEHEADLALEIPAAESRWIVARCSRNTQFAPLSGPETNPHAAHTSAVYVRVKDRPRFNPGAAAEWIQRMTTHAEDLERHGRFTNAAEREEAVSHVRAGLEAYRRLVATQGREQTPAPAPRPRAPAQPRSTSGATAAAPERIVLTPVDVPKPVHRQAGMREGQDLSRMAFRLQAPWMTGPVELRFPEVLRSSAGFHFLDNFSSSIQPLAEWDPFPSWQRDEATGRIFYDFTTPDGLRLVASAAPAGDEVRLEFTVVNQRPGAITRVEANCCLALNGCPELNAAWDPAIIHAVLDGRWTSFDRVTPTAAEIGRPPWFLSLREEATLNTDLPRVSPTWWRIDQHHTENLMGAVTRDRRWLIGITWSVEPIGLMSNGGNPCLHAGMGFSPEIPPGRSFTWHGKIYLQRNDPEALLARYRADQERWRALPEPSKARVRFISRESGSDVPMPARIHLRDAAGKPVHPPGLPAWHDHFVSSGQADLELPPGDYQFEVERGSEYTGSSGAFRVAAGEWMNLAPTLRRLADLAAEGWWSGDMHVHRDPAQAGQLLAAEDLHVAPITTWWNAHSAWTHQRPPANPLQVLPGNRLVHPLAGEDERDGGALLFINLDEPLDITRATRQYPHSLVFAQEIRKRPGAWIDLEKPFWWDLPAWLAAGIGDSVGIANNHQQRRGMLDNEAWGKARDRSLFPAPAGNGAWSQELYYRILNAGFRLPPSAGSASGVLPNPVGYNRAYVHLDGPLTWAAWWQGLRAGRVFVSNGPLLRCKANGQLPGHAFAREGSTAITIELEATLTSRDPVRVIEVVHNGEVVRRVPVDTSQAAQRLGTFRFAEDGWFLVRAIADVPDTFRFASTGPYYIGTNPERPRISKSAAAFFLDWTRERLAQIQLPDARQQAEVIQPWRAAEQFWIHRVQQAQAP